MSTEPTESPSKHTVKWQDPKGNKAERASWVHQIDFLLKTTQGTGKETVFMAESHWHRDGKPDQVEWTLGPVTPSGVTPKRHVSDDDAHGTYTIIAETTDERRRSQGRHAPGFWNIRSNKSEIFGDILCTATDQGVKMVMGNQYPNAYVEVENTVKPGWKWRLWDGRVVTVYSGTDKSSCRSSS
ncbi:hypothetical protein I302_101730 [Kwoniella bestiolae CBS 10118]|uniref:Uncharacterized protein n=1 Tax=Kwoniella bestiolae CBS 10118 TaxID=1296100 RepID=A0A1B9GD24_9TREE|nr:hypothetical protein I302_00406 [Kwoniella bestiolae CBS 10118]OCF28916.1 hypothetical protein I302_00406 [Kwoniella bestiolae CBS 10118]